VGKTLEAPLPANADPAVTVVLFVSKNCHFCSESMPFYRRLAALRVQGPGGLKLLAVTPAERETREDAVKYFADRDVALDGAGTLSFASLGVSGTPTIALLDHSKRVLSVWTGKLPSGTESQVISAIRALCHERAVGA
jgi:hypothetical protein